MEAVLAACGDAANMSSFREFWTVSASHLRRKAVVSDLQLAEFQSAGGSAIGRRIGSSQTFLLADEVGLGKTVVARGVIDNLLRRHRGKTLVSGLPLFQLKLLTRTAQSWRRRLATHPSADHSTGLGRSSAETLQLYSLPGHPWPRTGLA